jgi:hypothetical protein
MFNSYYKANLGNLFYISKFFTTFFYKYSGPVHLYLAVPSNIFPPVTILIAARNDSDNLFNNLPIILEQDYPEYEVIVINLYPLAYLVWQVGGLQRRAPGFMTNLYLYKVTVHGPVSQGASGLQPIHPKDVSTVPGCIHQGLRSTSR